MHKRACCYKSAIIEQLVYTDVSCSNAPSKRMCWDVNSTVNHSVQSGLIQLQSFLVCLDLPNGIRVFKSRLRRRGDKAFPCFRLFYMVNASGKVLNTISCVTFRNILIFYSEKFCQTPKPKPENHPLSTVRSFLFNIFAATYRIWRMTMLKYIHCNLSYLV
jgi:hypothetical protein